MTPTDWRATAAQAWKACDDRPLRRDEKIALVCEALTNNLERERTGGYSSTSIDHLAARSPLNARKFGAVCRHHLAEVNRLLGTDYRYCKAAYHPSGNGAFGRLGGSRPASYHKPCLI